MISNNCNNLSVDGGIPVKMDGTHHIMRYAHDAVFRPFFRGIPPSAEKLVQSLLKWTSSFPLSESDDETIIFWIFPGNGYDICLDKD